MVPRWFRSRQLQTTKSHPGYDAWSRASSAKAREWRVNLDSVMVGRGRGANAMGSSWIIAVTRDIPEAGLRLLREATTVKLWDQELPPSPDELDALLEGCDGAITLLTDRIDG